MYKFICVSCMFICITKKSITTTTTSTFLDFTDTNRYKHYLLFCENGGSRWPFPSIVLVFFPDPTADVSRQQTILKKQANQRGIVIRSYYSTIMPLVINAPAYPPFVVYLGLRMYVCMYSLTVVVVGYGFPGLNSENLKWSGKWVAFVYDEGTCQVHELVQTLCRRHRKTHMGSS